MNNGSPDDTVLIAQIARADRSAFDQLYERYHRMVFGIALAILGEPHTAEEVTLDVFMRVWQKASTYRADRAKVSTWLIALTRHHAIDILRRQRTRLKTDPWNGYENPGQDMPFSNDLEDQVDSAMTGGRIRAAFAQLPPEQRQALVMAYFKGLTHSEIAEALQEPLGTIKTRIRLGMQKLRQMLEEE